MNGVENLGRVEQSKFSRIFHCSISEIWTIVENLIAPRGKPPHHVPPASSVESAEGIFLWNGVENSTLAIKFSTPFHKSAVLAVERRVGSFMERRGKFDR